MRRLWRLWKCRREIRGEHFTVTITGRWWRRTDRRAAKITALLCDFAIEEQREEVHELMRRSLLYGDVGAMQHFVPDEWPYPDEDPPDPL